MRTKLLIFGFFIFGSLGQFEIASANSSSPVACGKALVPRGDRPTVDAVRAMLGEKIAIRYADLLKTEMLFSELPTEFYLQLARNWAEPFASSYDFLLHINTLCEEKLVEYLGNLSASLSDDIDFDFDPHDAVSSDYFPWLDRVNTFLEEHRQQGFEFKSRKIDVLTRSRIAAVLEALAIFKPNENINLSLAFAHLNQFSNIRNPNAHRNKITGNLAVSRYINNLVRKLSAGSENDMSTFIRKLYSHFYRGQPSDKFVNDLVQGYNASFLSFAQGTKLITNDWCNKLYQEYLAYASSFYSQFKKSRELDLQPIFDFSLVQKYAEDMHEKDGVDIEHLIEVIRVVIAEPGPDTNGLAENIKVTALKSIGKEIKRIVSDYSAKGKVSAGSNPSPNPQDVSSLPVKSSQLPPATSIGDEFAPNPTSRKRTREAGSVEQGGSTSKGNSDKKQIEELVFQFEELPDQLSLIEAGKEYRVKVMREQVLGPYILVSFDSRLLKDLNKMSDQNQSAILRAVRKGYARNTSALGGFEEGLLKLVSSGYSWELRTRQVEGRVLAESNMAFDGVFRFHFSVIVTHKSLRR